MAPKALAEWTVRALAPERAARHRFRRRGTVARRGSPKRDAGSDTERHAQRKQRVERECLPPAGRRGAGFLRSQLFLVFGRRIEPSEDPRGMELAKEVGEAVEAETE